MFVLMGRELKHLYCPVCNGSLLALEQGIWCDWCMQFLTKREDTMELDEFAVKYELSDDAKEELREMLATSYDEGGSDSYNIGYDNGYMDGENSCECDD